MMASCEERLRKLRHDLANPLSALMAETQLLLMQADALDAETVQSLRDMEALARRMRAILQDS